ncbi:hypothetical protein HZA56_03040 [Candidatus Poribacteria bacterium]|nr:hypothetical protein [Candidatus Poribacteria bacterium]
MQIAEAISKANLVFEFPCGTVRPMIVANSLRAANLLGYVNKCILPDSVSAAEEMNLLRRQFRLTVLWHFE